jgi:two-component system sensor histidine kinase PilS (NtrC family)
MERELEVRRRLKWAMALRIVIVTFLLGATIFIHLGRGTPFLAASLMALYLLSAVAYLVTLISALILRFLRKRIIGFAYTQIFWEVIFVTALIYITGGQDSIFSFLYLLTIIMAAILCYRRGAFLAASASSAVYAGLLLLLYRQKIPLLLPPATAVSLPNVYDLIQAISLNLFFFFVVAVLSSYLTEQLRATGTELKAAQDGLDKLEALNDSIVLSLRSGLITLNPSGRITSFNQAAELITGFPMAEALGRQLAEILPGVSLEQATPLDHPTAFKLPFTQRAGRRRILEVSLGSLVGPKGTDIGKLLLFADITPVVEMEERLRVADRLAAVGRLAAGMAHEIRNPLAAISGSIEVLERELDLDPVNRHLMQIVLRETDRLNNLITDFLLYARPIPRSRETIHLSQLIRDLLQVFAKRPDIPPGIQMETDLQEGLVLDSDPKLIRQILWNLINNAAEAMPQGGRLKLSCTQPDGPGAPDGFLEIRVQDTGCGIPAEHVDQIFEPFFTTREMGTGLGLSTVWRIVESMEGQVSVNSRVGEGSTFTVRLPRQQPSAEGITPS